MPSPNFYLRKYFSTLLLCVGLFALNNNIFIAQIAIQSPREVQSFDKGWRFFQGDVLNGQAAETSDSNWKQIDVPHDWAIAGPIKAENPSGGAGGFAPAGVSWYRKQFQLLAGAASKRIFIEFDGVMANSTVWINGEPLGYRPNGYVSFRYELTGKLRFGAGAENLLAVRTDTSRQPSSRWYQGAGIYRHVRLVVENPVHLAPWSIFITTPEVTAARATVKIQAAVTNQSDSSIVSTLRITLISPTGNIVGRALSKPITVRLNQSSAVSTGLDLTAPQLWDIESPSLYRAHVEILLNGKVIDTEDHTFGIREFHFDAATGFWLNGRNLKIKGVALHSDGGAVGVAVPLAVWEHKLNALRYMGANAIRTAHGPVAPEFLDLCDRMGFLVMDEFFDQWTVAKTPYDYHLNFREWNLRDLEDTVKRDRNHPSIILYSAGNEIRDTPQSELAKSILGDMVKAYHRTDPTRPVTQALFRPNVSHDYSDGLADMLDVVGQNYRTDELLAAHAQKPTRKIIGTENIHDLASWLALRDHPEYSGMFIWAATDYLGESRKWPLIGDAEGLLDRTDAPKPDALERESWWASHPVLHIVRRTAPTPPAPTDPGYEAEQYRPAQVLFHDWSPRNQTAHEETVEVYSNSDEVELFLNGRSLGSKPRNADDKPRKWSVSFEKGTLIGIGRSKGKEIVRESLQTAGAPVRIVLKIEQNGHGKTFDDVAYVRAFVEDANGVVVPDAHNLIQFSVDGHGEVLGTDNGDYVYESALSSSARTAFHGSAIAVIRAGDGKVVRATSPGLEPGSVAVGNPVTK